MCTSCPSPTPFGLGLGPTDPGPINVAQETLDLRRAGFSPTFTLLVPAFALVQAPHGLPFMLHRQPTTTLPLKAFRGEPAISWFDWHFTATHSSSAQFAT